LQNERERIRKRQREGIDSAFANGVKFGRPSIEITPKYVKGGKLEKLQQSMLWMKQV